MNWKLVAQMSLVTVQGISLYILLKQDVKGRPAKLPQPRKGVLSSLLAALINVLILWLAGSYSELTFK